jgi:hypothetical protein
MTKRSSIHNIEDLLYGTQHRFLDAEAPVLAS